MLMGKALTSEEAGLLSNTAAPVGWPVPSQLQVVVYVCDMNIHPQASLPG